MTRHFKSTKGCFSLVFLSFKDRKSLRWLQPPNRESERGNISKRDLTSLNDTLKEVTSELSVLRLDHLKLFTLQERAISACCFAVFCFEFSKNEFQNKSLSDRKFYGQTKNILGPKPAQPCHFAFSLRFGLNY